MVDETDGDDAANCVLDLVALEKEEAESLGELADVTAGDWLILDEDDSSWPSLGSDEFEPVLSGVGQVISLFDAVAEERGAPLSEDEELELLFGRTV
jgi:hypothetical protein